MKKVETIVIVFLIIFGVVGVGYGFYGIAKAKSNYDVADDEYEEYQNTYIEAPTDKEDVVKDIFEEERIEEDKYSVDFAKLQNEVNSDICGWIIIEDTEINYPILISHDNEEYLRKTPEGKEAISGSIFIDCECNRDFSSPNTIIYGHNMQNGSMFRALHSFKKKEFYDTHKNVYICKETGECIKYKIIGVFATEVGTDFYSIDFTESGYEEFLSTLKELAMYDTGNDVDENKRIVTLSTCVVHNSSERLVMVLQEE